MNKWTLYDILCYDYHKAVEYKEQMEKEYNTEFMIVERSVDNITFYLVTPFNGENYESN